MRSDFSLNPQNSVFEEKISRASPAAYVVLIGTVIGNRASRTKNAGVKFITLRPYNISTRCASNSCTFPPPLSYHPEIQACCRLHSESRRQLWASWIEIITLATGLSFQFPSPAGRLRCGWPRHVAILHRSTVSRALSCQHMMISMYSKPGAPYYSCGTSVDNCFPQKIQRF